MLVFWSSVVDVGGVATGLATTTMKMVVNSDCAIFW